MNQEDTDKLKKLSEWLDDVALNTGSPVLYVKLMEWQESLDKVIFNE